MRLAPPGALPPEFAAASSLRSRSAQIAGACARQEGQRGDVADGAVQADAVVVVDEARDDALRFLQGRRLGRTHRVALERLVPALDLAVRLRIVRRGAHVRHARQADELLEVLGDELRPVVRDDPRPRLRDTAPERAPGCTRRRPPSSTPASPSARWRGCSRRARCTGSRTSRRGSGRPRRCASARAAAAAVRSPCPSSSGPRPAIQSARARPARGRRSRG